ncbi:DNA polymerase III subunit delta [Candidatus Pelagibacter sp.]|nr:DNA polymerase III subunit delta [Candidatus Pelagibacter sp.]
MFFLFYGKNEGLKEEVINDNFIEKFEGQLIRYDESEFVNNFDNILEELLNMSLFGEKKNLIISRVTDKVLRYIEIILNKEIKDTKIILKSGILDKKSKLRSLFEKDRNLVSVPFYEDTHKNLYIIVSKFLNENNIKLSRELINILIDRSSGDRKNLISELDKILNYSKSNKKISFENIEKLTNLSENYAVSELAEQYLMKNKKKVAKILNENNYSNEDCIQIIRTILIKSKRLLGIIEMNNLENNIENVLSKTKPPIFWKEKEGVKIQVKNWKAVDLKNKIYEINEIETLIKTNSKNTLNLVSDFIVNY